MKELKKVIFLSSLFLISNSDAIAQQITPNYPHPTMLKCERTFTKNTPSLAKQKALQEKFVCEFEFVELRDNLSPVSTSKASRKYLSLEVPPKKVSATVVHELDTDYKLVKVTTSAAPITRSVYCEDKKGELLELRNDQVETPWSDKAPLKSSRTWGYKSLLKCSGSTGNGTA